MYQFLLVLVTAVVLGFQNCSPAQFSSAGESASGSDGQVGGSGGDIDPDDGGDGDGGDDGDIGDDGPPTEQPCGTELVKNGDFEIVDSRQGLVFGRHLDDLVQGNLWDVFTSLPDGSGGTSWTTHSGSGIEIQAGTTVPAASGQHFVELDSHPNSVLGSQTNSRMKQQVTIPASGRYILQYRYRGRAGHPEDNRIVTRMDDLVVRRFANAQEVVWQKVKVHITLAARNYQLSFEATGSATTYGGLIDNVSLKKACVP